MEKFLFQASPGKKKFVQPHLNGKSWVWWHMPVTPETVTMGSVKYKDHNPGKLG
jgi:uncharacterized protein (AIM24 family)